MTEERETHESEPTESARPGSPPRIVALKTTSVVLPGASASASLSLDRDADLLDVAPAMAGVRVMRILGGTARVEIDGGEAREALGPKGLHLAAGSHVIAMLRNAGEVPAILEAFVALANEGEPTTANEPTREPIGEPLQAYVVGSASGSGAVRRAVSADPSLPARLAPAMLFAAPIDPKKIVCVRLSAWQRHEVSDLVERNVLVSPAAAASVWGEISAAATRDAKEEKEGLALPWIVAEALRRALYGEAMPADARACVRSALDESRAPASEIWVPSRLFQAGTPMPMRSEG
jgi:hypothetical protein